MTITIDATVGGASSNSLITLAEAEAYMAGVLPAYQTAWIADATTELKKAAMIQASRLMTELPWIGSRATSAQPMAWPRIQKVTMGSYTNTPAMVDKDGYFIDSATIPWQVKNACAEYAYRLMSEDRSADAGGLVPSDLKVGSLSISNLKRNPIPASVLDIVSQFLTVDPRSGGELVRA